MKIKLVLIFILLCSTVKSNACLNFYYSVDNKGHLHPADELQVGFNTNFNAPLIEKKLKKLEEQLRQTHDYKLLSDYAVLLLKAGQTKTALDILSTLSKYYPDEYQIAANLGTAYELSGDLENAYNYIERGMKLNPDSHEGSEWVHLKILDTKKLLTVRNDYLETQSVLNLTEDQKKDSMIRKQILIQVRERFPFTPGPDPIMADILVDLGDCFANTASIEFAKVLYNIAQLYYGADEDLTNAKINEMIRLRTKYSDVRPEKRHSRGENMKLIGIRYKSMLDNNNPDNYVINWDKILTDTDDLLSLVNLKRLVEPDTIEIETSSPPIEIENSKEKMDMDAQGSNTISYVILVGILTILLGFIIYRRMISKN